MRSALFSAAALAAFSTSALADVDVEVRNGDIVSGTLNPATETETFRVQVPAGAKLSATVVGKPLAKKQPKPPLALRLLDGVDGVVAQSDGGAVKPKAKLKGIVIPASGEYRVVVTGDGATAGDYTLKIKWKQVKKVKIDKQTLNGPLQIPFAAEDGTFVSALIKATKGSTALPRLSKITNTGSSDEITPDAPPSAADKKHKIKAQELPGGGDFTLDIGNDGTAGEVSGKITLKAPKPTKTKVEVTAESLGTEVTDGVARGRVFGKAGGKLTIDASVSPLIAGAGLDVPPGALSSPTALVIGTAPNIAPPDQETEVAGPTVFFGPSGQTFGLEVTVTISFTGSSAGVFLVETDAAGNQTTITDNLTFDELAGTVSVKTTHFTRYRSFRPTGGPPSSRPQSDLDGDGISDLVIRFPADAGGVGTVRIAFGPLPPPRPLDGVPNGTNIAGQTPGDRFGTQHPHTADLDGDQRDELIVTNAAADGEVFVFQGLVRNGALNDSAAVTKFAGVSGDGSFGTAIATGDLNGDQVPDVVISAEDAVSGTGRAYVFFADPEPAFPFPASLLSSDADIVFEGGQPGDLLGATLAVGDVTGNESNDIVIGMDQADVGGANDPGHLLVFQGPFAGGGGTRTPGDATIDIVGENHQDGFGLDIALGDFDDNGQLDLVATAAGHDDPTGVNLSNVGAVYMIGGGLGLASGNAGVVGTKFIGIAADDDFGDSIAAGDVNTDGIDDIIVGSPGDDGPAPDSGAVFVFFGSTSLGNVSLGTILHGDASGDRMDIARPPLDLDNDGFTDLIAFSPQAAGTAGEVYVVFATSPFTFPVDTRISTIAVPLTGTTFVGTVPGDRIGGDD